ncbi:hypothetical protein C2G38_2069537 [Gigaspora rosea]|uniref:Uncharacterized protein n=1 Tax=Gigaspora rosea TaxID=44941 RepID=A0A397VRP9_9GLOM|nr:hypothetical protein C2G38_2069537 [Gigaspora rosea]
MLVWFENGSRVNPLFYHVRRWVERMKYLQFLSLCICFFFSQIVFHYKIILSF